MKSAWKLLTYRGLLNGGENTSGLHYVVNTSIAPLNVGRVPPVCEDMFRNIGCENRLTG